ncbi:MAG: hypothetical protein ACREQA_09225 [Candidatus Binatia bacterium]
MPFRSQTLRAQDAFIKETWKLSAIGHQLDPDAESVDSIEGKKTESRGHRNGKVTAGPDLWSKQPKGLARVALKVQAHCPRLEGFLPRVYNMTYC